MDCSHYERVANEFLSNGVMGKYNQYCGVKCIEVDHGYYLLEGDQADGYRIYSISENLLHAAGGEVCEASFKGYIEGVAIKQFYQPDGSGYALDNDYKDFQRIVDKKVLKRAKICYKKAYRKDIYIG